MPMTEEEILKRFPLTKTEKIKAVIRFDKYELEAKREKRKEGDGDKARTDS